MTHMPEDSSSTSNPASTSSSYSSSDSSTSTLARMARLFSFPTATFKDDVAQTWEELRGHPQAGAFMEESMEKLSHMTLGEQQEAYSRTFELSPAHTLDTSNHLYEGYQRTGCLSKLAAYYAACDFRSQYQDRGELPDHLPVVLEFVDALGQSGESGRLELRDDFCRHYLLPVLGRLRATFDEPEAAGLSPYRSLVDVARCIVESQTKWAG